MAVKYIHVEISSENQLIIEKWLAKNCRWNTYSFRSYCRTFDDNNFQMVAEIGFDHVENFVEFSLIFGDLVV